MASTIDSQILDAIHAAIDALPWVKKVESEKMLVQFADLQDFECPYVQIYDDGQTFEIQRPHVLTRWTLLVALVLRNESDEGVNQRVLLNKRNEIIEAVGAAPNFGIPGVIHALPISVTPELQVAGPFFVAGIEFEVSFRKPYAGDC